MSNTRILIIQGNEPPTRKEVEHFIGGKPMTVSIRGMQVIFNEDASASSGFIYNDFASQMSGDITFYGNVIMLQGECQVKLEDLV